MKRILRMIAIELAALYVANQLASGMVFERQPESILITAVALGLAMSFIKPIINILLLPLTLATMGIFKIIGHAVTLFVVDIALADFRIDGFNFPGITSQWLDLPAIQFASGPLAYLSFSIVLWFVSSVINWIRK